jgi:hypothetical protein
VEDDPAVRLQGLAVAGGEEMEADRERLDLPPMISERPDRVRGLKRRAPSPPRRR